MEIPESEPLLARQPLEPHTKRLGMGQNFLWLLAGVAGTAAVAVMWFSYTRQTPPALISEAKPPTRADIMAGNSSGDGVLPFQQHYLGHSREVPQPPPFAKPAPPKPEPLDEPIVKPLPPEVTKAATTASPFVQQGTKKEEKASPPQDTSTPPPQKGAATPPKKKLWLYVTVEANPFETKARDALGGVLGGEPGAEAKKSATSDLIKPAHWARAADAVHVLYNTQTIEGSVRQEINSETPGDVTILVTRNVYDALGQDEILIPQFSLMKGSYTGSTQYGQTRLDIGIRQIHFPAPDKTILSLEKAKLTDKSGAVGASGEVDNHYGKLGMAVVLSTLLNVGAQAIAGDTKGYYPTVEQKAAEQLGQGVNQAGQQIVKKQLDVGPTIRIHAGEPVGVQFSDNISLSKAPITIK
jgi:type IV secretory pathway VirB10-like protein